MRIRDKVKRLHLAGRSTIWKRGCVWMVWPRGMRGPFATPSWDVAIYQLEKNLHIDEH